MGRGKKIVDIELVVDEAVALIEEGGVEEFSTRRLASRLGISAMTLYNYYENRGAIIKGARNRGLDLLWQGLDDEVAAWRSRGGSLLSSYRLLAEHLLSFALSRPLLCRFVLAEGEGGIWNDCHGRIDGLLGPRADLDTAASEGLRRDVYLFELVIFALALKVIGGGETSERYKELALEGYDRLIAGHEGREPEA